MWYHVIVGVCFWFFNINAQTLGGPCRTPSNQAGTCISAFKCEALLSLLLSRTKTKEQTQFLHSSRCGADSRGIPYVCCEATQPNPTQPNPTQPDSVLPSRNECGFQATDKIVGGGPTNYDEFPWMAVFEYRNYSGHRSLACAGSLISPRYVLTAAHCVRGIDKRVGQLVNIRLGEYNTSSPRRDCITKGGITSCNGVEVNVGVEESILHPSYNANLNYNDIALVRLSKEVGYSEFIKPACLPLSGEESVPGEKVWVAGWGNTEFGARSDIKLKVQIPITSKSTCSDAFKLYRIDDGQICAGGEYGKDSCKGDSGGPLMRTIPSDPTRWMIEGIVSFGLNLCGSPGYPAVYTKVSKYVQWIHETVRP